jgi:hypothetical protein
MQIDAHLQYINSIFQTHWRNEKSIFTRLLFCRIYVDGFTISHRAIYHALFLAIPLDRPHKSTHHIYITFMAHLFYHDAIIVVGQGGKPCYHLSMRRHARKPHERDAMKVLAVDDNLLNLKLITTLLQSRGHDVRAVGTPNTVVEEARAFRPDVVFLDIAMPDRDGVAVMQDLRGCAELRGLPIHALTAHTTD